MNIVNAVLTKYIDRFERSIRKHGLHQTMRKLTRSMRTSLTSSVEDDFTTEVLAKKSVIVVSNHPHIYDSINLLTQLPDRPDVAIVMNAMVCSISPSVEKYMLPVHIRHTISRWYGKVLVVITDLFFPSPTLSPEESRKENKKSLKKSVEKLARGEMVIIFPNPHFIRKGPKWFSGVGQVIQRLKNPSSCYLVKAHINVTSDLDFMRVIPYLGALLPTIHITFSKAQRISELRLEKLDPEKITQVLQDEYEEWKEKIKKRV